jgi:hypothetical protein
MTPDEDPIIELIQSVLGRRARVLRHSRVEGTDLTFALKTVDSLLGKKCELFWNIDGLPNSNALIGLPGDPIVTSTRYLEMAAFLRGTLADTTLNAERHLRQIEIVLLRLLGEMAMYAGDPDFGVMAFAKAVTLWDGIWRAEPHLFDVVYVPVSAWASYVLYADPRVCFKPA